MNDEAIALFGASGQTGREVAKAATAAGIPLIGLYRSEASAAEAPAGVTARLVDLDEPQSVSNILEGASSVIIALGPRPPYREFFCADVTRTIIGAMQARGCRRLVCLTGAMVGDYPERWSLGTRLMVRFYRSQQAGMAADRAAQEQAVIESGLEWTLVKPPRLTNGAARGTYRAAPALTVGLMSRISRSDLAMLLIALATRHQHLGERLFVCY